MEGPPSGHFFGAGAGVGGTFIEILGAGAGAGGTLIKNLGAGVGAGGTKPPPSEFLDIFRSQKGDLSNSSVLYLFCGGKKSQKKEMNPKFVLNGLKMSKISSGGISRRYPPEASPRGSSWSLSKLSGAGAGVRGTFI